MVPVGQNRQKLSIEKAQKEVEEKKKKTLSRMTKEYVFVRGLA